MTERKPNISRTGVRIIHIAYDLDDIARRLNAADVSYEAEGVREVARTLHRLGRAIDQRHGKM